VTAGRFGIGGAVAVTAAAFSLAAMAQDSASAPVPPVKIGENVYYVGSSDYASYLIVTRDGMIVIDGGDAPTGTQVLANIRTLGFDPRQVKILLNTHGHWDHAAGLAQLKRETGALLYAGPDGPLIARGGKGDFYLKDEFPYEPVTPDRPLVDGQKLTLGGVTLTANITGGHTQGCTTWTFPVTVAGTVRQALVHCSSSFLPRYRLTPPETYPGQVADYEKSYRFWTTAPCEVFLGSHARFFGLAAKRQAVAAGKADAFVDPQGCKAYYASEQAAFRTELARQRAAAR
jgi:metallo-beta-lactamase class B